MANGKVSKRELTEFVEEVGTASLPDPASLIKQYDTNKVRERAARYSNAATSTLHPPSKPSGSMVRAGWLTK